MKMKFTSILLLTISIVNISHTSELNQEELIKLKELKSKVVSVKKDESQRNEETSIKEKKEELIRNLELIRDRFDSKEIIVHYKDGKKEIITLGAKKVIFKGEESYDS